MHICCANCALHPVSELKSEGVQLSGLWYNPNIHPSDEYGRRLGAVRRLESIWGLDLQYAGRSDPEGFKVAVEAHTGDRCEVCYTMRLGETAERAAAGGYDGFSTTLLVSPWQKHGLIAEVGRQVQEEHSVEFLYRDFRSGYNESRGLSRQLELYRQRYCGCLYSEEERTEKAPKKEMPAGQDGGGGNG